MVTDTWVHGFLTEFEKFSSRQEFPSYLAAWITAQLYTNAADKLKAVHGSSLYRVYPFASVTVSHIG
jgi:hypothetical protein